MDKELLPGQIYKCDLNGLPIKHNEIHPVIIVSLIKEGYGEDCFLGMPFDNLNNINVDEVRMLSKRRIIGEKIDELTDQQLNEVLNNLEVCFK